MYAVAHAALCELGLDEHDEMSHQQALAFANQVNHQSDVAVGARKDLRGQRRRGGRTFPPFFSSQTAAMPAPDR